jgi:histidinol phosphatase-like PHP family hydrolase
MQVTFNKQTKYINFCSVNTKNTTAGLQRAFHEKIKNFPSDLKYLKNLAEQCKLSNVELPKLTSVIGPAQLEFLLKNAPKNFYRPDNNFRLNLHIHTDYSDGKMSIPELLDQSSDYANELSSLKNFPNFTIAITDHDNIDGTKEALNYIIENAEKYRNLGIIFGSEISCIYNDKKAFNYPFPFEMLAFAINPFDNKLAGYLENVRKERIELTKNIINAANKEFPSYNFSFDEASIKAKNLQKGTNGFFNSLIKYFSEKAISEIDSKNFETFISKYLPLVREENSKINNSINDIFSIFKENFGFLGVAHPGRIAFSKGLIREDYVEKCKLEGKRAGKTIIDHFIQYLVKIGGKKFRVLETNYQGYCGNLKLANDILDGLISKTDNKQQNAINWINNFRVLAQRYNLLESGGLDTHGKTLLEHK